MPNSTGFGDYTEAGQVIPVRFNGQKGNYTHSTCSSTTIRRSPRDASCGAFRRSLPGPTLRVETDTLVGTLDYGPVRVATGTMGYKHREADAEATMSELAAPNFLLKIIPHVDGTPRICELVEYHLEEIRAERRLDGPGALSLNAHALAPVAELPVHEIVSTAHLVADLTLGLGKVVHDYLSEPALIRLDGLKLSAANG